MSVHAHVLFLLATPTKSLPHLIFIGAKFWKVNKKVNAVTEEDYALYSGKNIETEHASHNNPPISLSSSSDDFEPICVCRRGGPPKKKVKCNNFEE